MKKFSKILSTFLTASVLLCGCGVSSNVEEPEEILPNIDEAKEFMAAIEPEITAPLLTTISQTGIDYGEIIKTTYMSETCGRERPVNIVLPANYDKNKKYPVLYVLHGIFGDENSMLGDGNSGVRVIVGNLVNEGKSKEMIIVFPHMYASTDPDQQPSFDSESVKPYDNFVNDLVDDLMPFIQKNYSVKIGKKNTAIIGFSMGGRESLAIGLQHPELFGYVGAIAPAPGLVPGQDWAMVHEGQFAEDEVKFDDNMPWLLMVCAGDNDHTVGSFPKSYHELMQKNGVEHVWYEIPGSDHGDPAVASGLYNFAKYVFTVE